MEAVREEWSDQMKEKLKLKELAWSKWEGARKVRKAIIADLKDKIPVDALLWYEEHILDHIGGEGVEESIPEKLVVAMLSPWIGFKDRFDLTMFLLANRCPPQNIAYWYTLRGMISDKLESIRDAAALFIAFHDHKFKDLNIMVYIISMRCPAPINFDHLLDEENEVIQERRFWQEYGNYEDNGAYVRLEDATPDWEIRKFDLPAYEDCPPQSIIIDPMADFVEASDIILQQQNRDKWKNKSNKSKKQVLHNF